MRVLNIQKTFFWSYYKKTGTPFEETVEGTMPGTRAQGRSHTTWQENIRMWTELSSMEAARQWRTVHSGGRSVMQPNVKLSRIVKGKAKEGVR